MQVLRTPYFPRWVNEISGGSNKAFVGSKFYRARKYYIGDPLRGKGWLQLAKTTSLINRSSIQRCPIQYNEINNYAFYLLNMNGYAFTTNVR